MENREEFYLLSDSDCSDPETKKKRVEQWLNDCLKYYPLIQSEELDKEEVLIQSTDYSLPELQTDYKPINKSEDLNPNDFKGVGIEDVLRFRECLSRNVLGMSLGQFMDTYRQLFDEELKSGGFKSIVEMIHFSKVFGIEEIEDPEEDDRLPDDDVFGLLLFDARSHVLKKKCPKKFDKKKEKEIPESEQIIWLNAVIGSVNGLELKQYSVDFKFYGFESTLKFFERMSELIPIEVIDKRFIRLKPLSEIQDFVSKQLAKKNNNFLKEIIFWYLPQNSVIPGFEICVKSNEELFEKLKDRIKPIYITAIQSSKKFAAIVLEEDFCQFWKNIEEFYESDESIYYSVVPKEFVVSGLFCATKCENNGWIRVKVIKTPDFNETNDVKLKAIDFGYKLKAEYKDLRLLRSDFGEFPIQLIHLSLYGVKKVKKVETYFSKYRNQRKETPKDEQFCQFVKLNNKRIEVILFETDDLYEYYSIGQLMIEEFVTEKTDNSVDPDWEQLFNTVSNYYGKPESKDK